jgi:hypothetical protein
MERSVRRSPTSAYDAARMSTGENPRNRVGDPQKSVSKLGATSQTESSLLRAVSHHAIQRGPRGPSEDPQTGPF